MNELIKKILNELNINEKNGLASNENYNTQSYVSYRTTIYDEAYQHLWQQRNNFTSPIFQLRSINKSFDFLE